MTPVQTYIDQISTLLRDPTANLVAAAIGVSIIVILLVIVVLVLLFFALAPSSSKKGAKTGTPKKRKSPKPTAAQIAAAQAKQRRARRITALIVTVGVIGTWIALFAGTSVNAYCGNTCHSMVEPSDTWKESAHSSVRCVRCHEGSPATTLVTGSVARLQSVVDAVLDTSSPRTPVPSGRCLACHTELLGKTVITTRAIAMSHAEPVQAGATCADCHGAQGHTGSSLIVGMDACLRCHDGEKAPTTCTVCHPRGIEASIEKVAEQIGDPVRLPVKPTCGGCHSQEKCDACHGLRLPHPADYKTAKGHARAAAFEGKERLCFRCHAPSDCIDCHPTFVAHGKDWKQGHKQYERKDGNAYCLWCHETRDFCGVCH